MRSGLTKLEILVVVCLGVFALALLIPFVLHQRAQSRRLACEQRLTHLAMAVQGFDDRHDQLPGYRNLQAVDEQGGDRATGWVFPLLPFLDASDPAGGGQTEAIFREYGPEGSAASRGKLPTQLLPEVLCPALSFTSQRRKEQPLTYVANCGQPDADVPADGEIPPDWPASGLFFDHLRPAPQRVSVSLAWLSKHDGTQQTLLLSENVDAGRWVSGVEAEVGILWVPHEQDGVPTSRPIIEPINVAMGEQRNGSVKLARPSSVHNGGVNVVMADAKTQFLSQQIDYLVYVRMLTSNGQDLKVAGEDRPLGKPWSDAKGESIPQASP